MSLSRFFWTIDLPVVSLIGALAGRWIFGYWTWLWNDSPEFRKKKAEAALRNAGSKGGQDGSTDQK